MPDPVIGQSDNQQEPQPQPQPQPAPRDWLPEEIRAEKALEKFKDVSGLAKSYVDLEKKLGSSFSIPAPEDQAGWVELHKKLGRPDAPEAYQITQPVMNAGIEWDAELEGAARKWAHSIGLNNNQMQSLVNFWGEFMNGVVSKSDSILREEMNTLKSEWGTAYPKGLELAKRFAAEYGGQEGTAYWKNLGQYNPLLIRMFARAGEVLVAEGHIDGEMPGMPSKAEAKAKIEEYQAAIKDRNHPYWNGSHPGHKKAVEDFMEWQKILNAP